MKILGSDVPIKENLLFSFNRYLIWWLILLITMAFDFLTTFYFVSKLGADAEANLVVRWLISHIGLSLGALVGKLLQLISVILFVCLHQRLGNIFLLVVILLNCWAIVMNTIPNY